MQGLVAYYSVHQTHCWKPGGRKPSGGRGNALYSAIVILEHSNERHRHKHELRADYEKSLYM